MLCLLPATQAVGLGCNVSGLRPDLKSQACSLKPAVDACPPNSVQNVECRVPFESLRALSMVEGQNERRTDGVAGNHGRLPAPPLFIPLLPGGKWRRGRPFEKIGVALEVVFGPWLNSVGEAVYNIPHRYGNVQYAFCY